MTISRVSIVASIHSNFLQELTGIYEPIETQRNLSLLILPHCK
jgi:hypothetical protein